MAKQSPVAFQKVMALLESGIHSEDVVPSRLSLQSSSFLSLRERARPEGHDKETVLVVNLTKKTLLRLPVAVDTCVMHPFASIVALKSGATFQVFHLELKAKLDATTLTETVVFWTWSSPTSLVFVTDKGVLEWDVAPTVGRYSGIGGTQSPDVAGDQAIEGEVRSAVPLFEREKELVGAHVHILSFEKSADGVWAFLHGVINKEARGGLDVLGTPVTQVYSMQKRVSEVLVGAYAPCFISIPEWTQAHQYLCYVYRASTTPTTSATAEFTFQSKLLPAPSSLMEMDAFVMGLLQPTPPTPHPASSGAAAPSSRSNSPNPSGSGSLKDESKSGAKPGADLSALLGGERTPGSGAHTNSVSLAVDDFPVYMVADSHNGLAFVASFKGRLLLLDVMSGRCVFTQLVWPQLTVVGRCAGGGVKAGLVSVDDHGRVSHFYVDDAMILSHLMEGIRQRSIAAQVARRQFEAALRRADYPLAIKLAVAPHGLLRGLQTIDTLRSLNLPKGQGLAAYFQLLLSQPIPLSAEETVALCAPLGVSPGGRDHIKALLADNKLSPSVELGDSLFIHDATLALTIYVKVNAHAKAVGCFLYAALHAPSPDQALNYWRRILEYEKRVKYTPDYVKLLQDAITVNPSVAKPFALALVQAADGSRVSSEQVVEVLAARSLVPDLTHFTLDYIGTRDDAKDGALQTRVLELNILTAPQVAEAILQSTEFHWRHFDKLVLARAYEKAHMLDRALALYQQLRSVDNIERIQVALATALSLGDGATGTQGTLPSTPIPAPQQQQPGAPRPSLLNLAGGVHRAPAGADFGVMDFSASSTGDAKPPRGVQSDANPFLDLFDSGASASAAAAVNPFDPFDGGANATSGSTNPFASLDSSLSSGFGGGADVAAFEAVLNDMTSRLRQTFQHAVSRVTAGVASTSDALARVRAVISDPSVPRDSFDALGRDLKALMALYDATAAERKYT